MNLIFCTLTLNLMCLFASSVVICSDLLGSLIAISSLVDLKVKPKMPVPAILTPSCR